ncbi:hypothetical protein F511_00992 [Dorcoceras hygrometricum]|uniref:Uncharacterized protein n=1 Tax=Dorcoceras hygrometricum TaxID=472368 RepID=A0A2Z7AEH1_9LAMI|nr:hypothetical protein F511_00992 [Dorcoceras hygrometricum]
MKRCSIPTRSKQQISLLASATEDESSVSEILLELGNLFMLSELRTRFTWGSKKRRSGLAEASSYYPEQPTLQPASVQVSKPQVKAEEECAAAKTSSPTTPLSFLRSESDEKSNHYSKKRSRRSREKYNNMIEELIECGDLLRQELEKVRNYYNELRSYNAELKAMKLQVLKTCPKKEDSQMETIGFTNFVVDVDPTQHYRITMLTHQQPFIAEPMAQKFQHSFWSIASPRIGSFLKQVNQVGPDKIPDLNLSAEEAVDVDASQPLDVDRALADKRARFSEARRRRIIKIKSMRNACGLKLP